MMEQHEGITDPVNGSRPRDAIVAAAHVPPTVKAWFEVVRSFRAGFSDHNDSPKAWRSRRVAFGGQRKEDGDVGCCATYASANHKGNGTQ
jgi:hypothetical protein